MNILFIGDIVGRPGRDLVHRGLRGLVEYYGIDLVIANAENSANGFGITRDIGHTLLEWGVDGLISNRPDLAVRVRDEFLATQATKTVRS